MNLSMCEGNDIQSLWKIQSALIYWYDGTLASCLVLCLKGISARNLIGRADELGN
jgi:hypothetical protein